MSEISRSHFLKLIAAGGASFLGLSQFSLAEPPKKGPYSPWARLKFMCENGDDDDWNVHPNGDLNLIDAANEQTSMILEKEWNVADINKLDTMTAFPFLFMHADVKPDLDDLARANLREYMLRGGFLFAEDCVNGKRNQGGFNDGFFRKMAEQEIPKIFPDARLERLPNDHPVFHTVYHLKNGIPHMQGVPHGLHAVTVQGRVVMLLSPSDIHCGWTNGERWFGPEKGAQALEMGINIYAYAMTQPGSLACEKGIIKPGNIIV